MNAPLNQAFLTLYDMLKIQSNLNLEQLVVNGTPTFKSAMLGYSQPLNYHFQISGDVTVVNLNQPIARSSWNKALSFEAEVGVPQTWSDQAGVKNSNTDLFPTVGFRYDFYADDGATRDNDTWLSTRVDRFFSFIPYFN